MNTILIKKKKSYNLFIYIIILVLGGISAFSLTPYNFLFINFLTYPLLFFIYIYNSKTKKNSFLIGWLFGFGYFLLSLYWVSNALTFDQIFKPLIPFVIILIPLFLGLFYGAATFLIYFFKLKKNLSSIFIFSLILSLLEYVRGNILTGFPWNLIVYSLSNSKESIQILSIIGTYTLNLICISYFLLPSIIFFNIRKKNKIILATFFLILIILNFIFGISKISNLKNTENIIFDKKIIVVSPKIKIDRYFLNEDPIMRLSEIFEIIKPYNKGDELYILPEGILSGIYLNDLKKYKKLFEKNFSENDNIILGISTLNKNEVYNSLVLLDRNLNVLDKYDKNKLVPFGEYLPFESLLEQIGLKKITQGFLPFKASNKRELIKLDNFNFLPLICYEIIFSGKLSKNKKKYDSIINISEDGWFGKNNGPSQHFSHSVFRSIEEGKSIIRSSNNGISALIDPTGHVVSYIESTNSGVIEINYIKSAKTTSFSKHGNKIFFYFLLFYITFIFFLKRRERTLNEKKLSLY